MGTWHLEIAKMAIYLAFPVAIFYWFNKPGNFDEYVDEMRKKYGIVDDPAVKTQIDEFIDKFNKEKAHVKYASMDTQNAGNN